MINTNNMNIKKIRNLVLMVVTTVVVTALFLLAFFAPQEIWAPWFMAGFGIAVGLYLGTSIQALVSHETIDELKKELDTANENLAKANKANRKLRKRLNRQNKDASKAQAQSWDKDLTRIYNDPDLADDPSVPSTSANADAKESE